MRVLSCKDNDTKAKAYSPISNNSSLNSNEMNMIINKSIKLTLLMLLFPLTANSQIDIIDFCKMRVESDARYIAYRQQGLSKAGLIELENERINHIAKQNNVGLDFTDQYKRFVESDISTAYEITVGVTEEEKLQIAKDYVLSRMQDCVRENSK